MGTGKDITQVIRLQRVATTHHIRSGASAFPPQQCSSYTMHCPAVAGPVNAMHSRMTSRQQPPRWASPTLPDRLRWSAPRAAGPLPRPASSAASARRRRSVVLHAKVRTPTCVHDASDTRAHRHATRIVTTAKDGRALAAQARVVSSRLGHDCCEPLQSDILLCRRSAQRL